MIEVFLDGNPDNLDPQNCVAVKPDELELLEHMDWDQYIDAPQLRLYMIGIARVQVLRERYEQIN